MKSVLLASHVKKMIYRFPLMSTSLKITKRPGWLSVGFLVTKKPAPGTKKHATRKPGNKYGYRSLLFSC